MGFTCECCHYSTEIKCNYVKHVKSKRHKSKSIPKKEVNPPELVQELVHIKTYKCKNCDKEYKHRPSLSKHKNSCMKVTEDKDQMIKELLHLLNEKINVTRNQLDLIQKQLNKS
jgi:hypothetical protein